MRLRRRRWFRLAIVFGCAAIGLALWAFWLEPARLIVSAERITLERPLRGTLRIAILTDLHVGSPFNGLSKLREIVNRTNAASPDIVCILGDLVIQGVKGGRFVTPEDIASELSNLRGSRIFAVLGNHDGWLDHDRVQAALERIGIRVVEETALKVDTVVGPLWVAGISDVWTGRHDIDAALASVENDGAPVILLTHNPDVFPMVPARVSLTLAGHTHGGQVRLPFIGRPIVPSRFGQRFAAGHIVENGRHLYVATGLGTSILPVRFRVPPTITMLSVDGT